ncbi:MAG: hypothetical protein CR997_11420 [Acidobacteria bacterium]|nr:MAG: hypothetical protein CR997_11420 [Acidobacteriota bacterium]
MNKNSRLHFCDAGTVQTETEAQYSLNFKYLPTKVILFQDGKMAKRKPKKKRRLASLGSFIEAFYSMGLLFLEVIRYMNPFWLPCVVLNTFRFYLYLPVFALILWSLAKKRYVRHLFAYINLACFLYFYGFLFLPKLSWEPEGKNAGGLKVMTFNIQANRQGTDGIIEYLKTEQPDVLALQEIQNKSVIIDSLRKNNYHFGHRPYYENSSIGMLIAVKKPLKLNRVLRKTYHKKGRWSYLFAEVINDSGTTLFNEKVPIRFNVVCPHLLPFGLRNNILKDLEGNLKKINRHTVWQVQETIALLELVKGFEDPTVMLGDFNSTPEQKLHLEINNYMNDCWLDKGYGYGGTRTFFVPLRIDYIYLTPHFNVYSSRRGPSNLSDHRAVITKIGLND